MQQNRSGLTSEVIKKERKKKLAPAVRHLPLVDVISHYIRKNSELEKRRQIWIFDCFFLKEKRFIPKQFAKESTYTFKLFYTETQK